MAVVICVDIDRFGDMTREKGWTPYSPNPVTRYLTHAVSAFAESHAATILYGLDSERGTEEAQLYCSSPDLTRIIEDLEEIRAEMRKMGASLSVGIASVASGIPPKALKDFPLAKKALRESKRKKEIVLL